MNLDEAIAQAKKHEEYPSVDSLLEEIEMRRQKETGLDEAYWIQRIEALLKSMGKL